MTGCVDFAELEFHIDETLFENTFSNASSMKFYLIQEDSWSVVGLCCFYSQKDSDNLADLSLAGPLQKTGIYSGETGVRKRSRVRQNFTQPNKIVRNDIESSLKDLNLLPQIGSNLACAMCPYVATVRSSLKTHYKLKHLGGADLAVNCSICSKRCTTKGNLVAHIIAVHKLTREDAHKLAK